MRSIQIATLLSNYSAAGPRAGWPVSLPFADRRICGDDIVPVEQRRIRNTLHGAADRLGDLSLQIDSIQPQSKGVKGV